MKSSIARGAAIGAALTAALPAATVITYEDATLGAAGVIDNTPYIAAGVTHSNSYSGGYWEGFAISNRTDKTTPGWNNQYSSYSGAGVGGSAQYAVGFIGGFLTSTRLEFPGSTSLTGMGAAFNNTTYTALSMKSGDAFTKKFGGADGTDPDFLRLTITGYLGAVTTGAVDFYLADFRGDAASDHIVDEWTQVDFTPLGTVTELRFTMSSSDNGAFGMNTPAYFAMDNLVVPEPSALTLGLSGSLVLLRRRRRHVGLT
jgi:hypothetical protein